MEWRGLCVNGGGGRGGSGGVRRGAVGGMGAESEEESLQPKSRSGKIRPTCGSDLLLPKALGSRMTPQIANCMSCDVCSKRAKGWELSGGIGRIRFPLFSKISPLPLPRARLRILR